MDILETLIVECPQDECGAKYTKMVVEDNLSDLAIVRVFRKIRIFVDTREPVFIFASLLRPGSPPVKIKDFTTLEIPNIEKDEIKITLENETYLVKLLTLLWDRYGRENITQPDKKTIMVKTPNKTNELDRIKDTVIEEPYQEVLDKLIDAVALRIIPEAFRVRNHEISDKHLLFVSSENTIEQKWMDRAAVIMKDLREKELESGLIF